MKELGVHSYPKPLKNMKVQELKEMLLARAKEKGFDVGGEVKDIVQKPRAKAKPKGAPRGVIKSIGS